MKKNLIKIKDGARVLYYRRIETRQDGVCATLVGYRKKSIDKWY